jgi:Leucine-rich repeat (LRR) protein
MQVAPLSFRPAISNFPLTIYEANFGGKLTKNLLAWLQYIQRQGGKGESVHRIAKTTRLTQVTEAENQPTVIIYFELFTTNEPAPFKYPA